MSRLASVCGQWLERIISNSTYPGTSPIHRGNITPLEARQVRWPDEVWDNQLCSLWMYKQLLRRSSPLIHGGTTTVCVSCSVPNWLDVGSATHNPPAKTSVRDGPETCCCFQEGNVPPEVTRCIGVVPVPEVRSESHEKNPVRF